MMKALILLCLLTCHPLFAFDPAGPPPKRTMEWTTRILANVKIPHIDLEEAALIDALVFASRIDIPKAYRVWLEYPEAMEQSDVRITLEARDISWMELLGIIAEKGENGPWDSTWSRHFCLPLGAVWPRSDPIR
jgi:hypothetical protein